MNNKFSSKRTYKICYILFIFLFIFSLICSIPAPVFLVFAVLSAIFAYKMRKSLKNYDMEKEAFDKKKAKEAEMKAMAEASPTVICPKCGSSSITAGRKRLSIGRAAVGGALFGEMGAAVGAVTSGKTECTCLKCGYTWKI